MAARRAVKLTRSFVERLPAPRPGQRTIVWDAHVPGLGLVVHASGRKSWCLYHRTKSGRQRKPKLGDYGVLTIELARDLAIEVLGEVARGKDPAGARVGMRQSPSMADLWKRYWEEHAELHKAESSSRKDKGNWNLHLAKRLGSAKVVDVTHPEIATIHQAIGKTAPGAANRCLSLLSKMFNLAERWGLRSMGSNPCRHVVRFRERKIERYLSAAEYRRLSAVLVEEDARRRAGQAAISESSAIAIRLLILTGCRMSEIAGLRWSEVDLQRRQIRLERSKVGGHVLQLNDAALTLFKQTSKQPGNAHVCVAHKPTEARRSIDDISWRTGHISDSALECAWAKIRTKAKLDGVRLHDLRHSFASMAAAEGFSLHMIGKLLGHKTPATTERYAHLADDPTQRAARRIGNAIERVMVAPKRAARGRRR